MEMVLIALLCQNMKNVELFFILKITDIFMNAIYIFLFILFFSVGVKGASTWWTGHRLNGRSCVSRPWWVTQKALAETHPCIHAPIDVRISKTNGLTTVTYLVAALDDLCSRVKRLSVCVWGLHEDGGGLRRSSCKRQDSEEGGIPSPSEDTAESGWNHALWSKTSSYECRLQLRVVLLLALFWFLAYT